MHSLSGHVLKQVAQSEQLRSRNQAIAEQLRSHGIDV
jgi:hypothetical protein